MPNTSRLAGRFFSVLISFVFAIALPHTAVAGEAVPSPAASPIRGIAALPSAHFAGWPVDRQYTLAALAPLFRLHAFDVSGPTLCQIVDTVYRADGTAAQGTIVIVWPAFTTAAGQPIAPGMVTVQLGAEGQFNASLAPNRGATPAGTYYRATYKLNDGSTSSEYWVVPATQTTTIGAIRSTLVPVSQAAQFLTREFADANYMNLTASQTAAGVKIFTNSPSVPTPQNPNDAANKSYVDANGGNSNLGAPPPIGNVTPNSGNFTTLAAQSSNGIPNPAGFPQSDPCAKINSAIATLPSAGGTVDARAFAPGQSCSTTIALNKPATLLFGSGQWTLAGCPGIDVSSPGVSIVGLGQTLSGVDGGLSATALMSNPPAPCPLLQSILAPSDSATIRDIELDGNSQKGLIGVFWPWSGNLHLINVRAHDFLQQGIYAVGGLNFAHDLFLSYNGGDGFELGSDGMIDGRTEFFGNGKAGLHIVAGGNRISNINSDFNGTQGIYLDGRLFPDWTASTAQAVGNILRPASGNNNSYAFVAISCTGDCKTGTVAPVWNQTPGTQIVDNHVTWLDSAGLAPGGSNGYANQVTAPDLAYNLAEQLRLEGDPSHAAQQNVITGFYGDTAGSNSTASSMGLHLLYAAQTVINGGTYYGSAIGQQNDLGGYVIDASSAFTALSNCNSYLSHSSAIQVLAGSSYTSISNCQVYNNADSTTTGNNVYGIYLATGTLYTTLSNATVVDSRSTPYSLGLYDYGTGDDQAGGYRSNIVGNPSPDRFASTPGVIVDQDSGLGHNLRLSSPDHITFGSIWTNPSSVNYNGFSAPSFASYSTANPGNTVTVSAPTSGFSPYSMTWPTAPGASGQCLTSSGGGSSPMTWSACNNVNLSAPPPIGNVTPNTVNATALTFQSVPGVEFLVSHYANIQAAINAAYNNGTVLGAVVDDRTSPYTGPGFILYDSVTLKLAPTTYTINTTVTYNNGNNNVTAGIVALPGGRVIGTSTSTNHGTIVTAANGLNADLIATSTVGTGIGSTAQWWHWGGFENLRVIGNGANQNAGNCFNIENMGETAFLRTIEVSNCYLDNILFTGASATPSDIANITTNSAGRYGFNFNNLSGVAVVHGLSGDSNTNSIVRLNGGQSGTLTILGFKTEEEISGQDPLITIDQTGENSAQPGLFIIGGYTFGRAGVNDVIKYVNGTAGTTPFISVSNFYLQNYVNAVNDTVNNRTTAAANLNKVPFYYGPSGAFYSGQAYTLDLNTFAQSPHSGNGILTEIFGTTSSNETLLAASGTSTSISTGGIGFRMPNRTTYGQSPELFAKMTYAFPGGVSNNQQWEFIPAKATGDTSTRWIGDPGYRWDEVYSTDVNTTTATVGTLNVTNCVGCGTGTHLISGTMQGATAALTGNSSDQIIYAATLPAGTFTVGSGAHCFAKWTHFTASGAITYKWTLGATTWAYGSYTSSSQNVASDIEVLTISSLSSQAVNLSPVIAGTAIGIGGSYGNAGAENLANSDTIKLTFNGGSSDQIKGATFYCQTIQ